MTTISQCGHKHEFDVVVIGAGIAGLNFILALSELKPEVRIALISKQALIESNSRYAQGGIAAASNIGTIKNHIADTMAAGDGLADKQAVEKILAASLEGVKCLTKHGVNFDKNAQQEPDLAQEGGHSERRIFHCGDSTGLNIVNALIESVLQLSNVECFEYHSAVNLITQSQQHQPGCQQEVVGIYLLNEKTSLIHEFLAQTIVLATGGAGKTYRFTTNSEVATGDGLAMAYRAGARVGNMEFYQFHPSLLYHTEMNSFLISEALRGEGAHLLLPNTGERFMQRYAAEKMELATRDVVARAIFTEIESNTHNYVYLDISHKSTAFLQQRFPTIYNTLKTIGIDMSQDPIPVVPAAHYLCGGILTDVHGKTDIKRLYAIGETAFTGLHGANRLASNSLLEGTVMARFAARDCLACLDEPVKLTKAISPWSSRGVSDLRRASQINANWRGLRGEMTSYAGIIRTEAGLKDLLRLILIRREIIEEYYWKHTITRDLLELRNITLVSELIVRSALQRRESRGGHYRADYPQKISQTEESIFHFQEASVV